MTADWLSQTDICIKTYKRPAALERLKLSIERYYPGAKVTVNGDKCLAAGRNAMVDATDRPFLLFLDDDFEFTVRTHRNSVDRLMAAMDVPEIGIVGGSVFDCIDGERCPRNSGGTIKIRDGAIYLDKSQEMFVDVVPNFFLARREVFDKCRWRWGVGAEHLDFFLQVRDAGWMVFNAVAVTIDHHPFTPALPGYKADRWDVSENVVRFMLHWNLERIVVNGKVLHSLPVGAGL